MTIVEERSPSRGEAAKTPPKRCLRLRDDAGELAKGDAVATHHLMNERIAQHLAQRGLDPCLSPKIGRAGPLPRMKIGSSCHASTPSLPGLFPDRGGSRRRALKNPPRLEPGGLPGA
jgi:hypothetical protein